MDIRVCRPSDKCYGPWRLVVPFPQACCFNSTHVMFNTNYLYKSLSPPSTGTIEYIHSERGAQDIWGWECEGLANIVLVGCQLALLTHTHPPPFTARSIPLNTKSNPVPRCAWGHNSFYHPHAHLHNMNPYYSASTSIFLVEYLYIILTPHACLLASSLTESPHILSLFGIQDSNMYKIPLAYGGNFWA